MATKFIKESIGKISNVKLISGIHNRHFDSLTKAGEWLGCQPNRKAIYSKAKSMLYTGLEFDGQYGYHEYEFNDN